MDWAIVAGIVGAVILVCGLLIKPEALAHRRSEYPPPAAAAAAAARSPDEAYASCDAWYADAASCSATAVGMAPAALPAAAAAASCAATCCCCWVAER
ncbi:hypothetical protein PRIPAC_84867 [Pristionchus pacificus]|uniref:Uncharacterized protein n=1 Tax=Pristionchus pacificus TaxID=54126 RepID=A0A2A6BU31_PRIPA|nr:hypothetical protein PRIPAC_84867 [Pristionchus pacificus]|eukprot:PDM69415.1 hypothetical protein PRIPAC_44511 [Pristionchus pacificus]